MFIHHSQSNVRFNGIFGVGRPLSDPEKAKIIVHPHVILTTPSHRTLIFTESDIQGPVYTKLESLFDKVKKFNSKDAKKDAIRKLNNYIDYVYVWVARALPTKGIIDSTEVTSTERKEPLSWTDDLIAKIDPGTISSAVRRGQISKVRNEVKDQPFTEQEKRALIKATRTNKNARKAEKKGPLHKQLPDAVRKGKVDLTRKLLPLVYPDLSERQSGKMVTQAKKNRVSNRHETRVKRMANASASDIQELPPTFQNAALAIKVGRPDALSNFFERGLQVLPLLKHLNDNEDPQEDVWLGDFLDTCVNSPETHQPCLKQISEQASLKNPDQRIPSKFLSTLSELASVVRDKTRYDAAAKEVVAGMSNKDIRNFVEGHEIGCIKHELPETYKEIIDLYKKY
jgi:hypothetical protein